ncbi:hypothetical protein N9R78_01010 [Pelagibacteraceae bacterium]|nr:hypothetical protein [Pelagibacteraceae bacterium]
MRHILLSLILVLTFSSTVFSADATCVTGDCINNYSTINYGSHEFLKSYVGELKDSVPHGHGRMIYKDGSVYEGKWKDFEWNGQGKYTEEGNVVNGIWEGYDLIESNSRVTESRPVYALTSECVSGDCANGYGTQVYDNANKYSGEHKNNTKHGAGTYSQASGMTFSGFWENDKLVQADLWISKNPDSKTVALKLANEIIESKSHSLCIKGDCINGIGIFVNRGNGLKYEGEWKDGYRHGFGGSIGLNNYAYLGEWSKGQKSSEGKTYYPNGDIFEGLLLNEDKCSVRAKLEYYPGGNLKPADRCPYGAQKGTMTYANGDKFEGLLCNRKPFCEGTFTYSNGEIISGIWGKSGNLLKDYNAKPTDVCTSGNCNNGYGVYVSKNGGIYEGENKNNRPHGKGKFTYNFNKDLNLNYPSVYDGEWRDGLKHGQGTMLYFLIDDMSDRVAYEGKWSNNKKLGQGKMTYVNGNIYEGEFDDNTLVYGTMNFANGNRYVGKLSLNKPNKIGVMYYANGDKYEGEWSFGDRHGQGTYTDVDGTKREGKWFQNRFAG